MSLWLIRPTALGLLLLSSGCASMYNPLTPGLFEKQTDALTTRCATPEDYQKGIKCAQEVQDKYLEAATADATMSDRFFVAMVPISLAAVGVGIAGGSGNAITGLALASATGLGWGTWLTSKTRRELFGLGAQAINCVITASSPLDIPGERLTSAKNHEREVRTALSGFATAIEEFSWEIANEKKKPNGGVGKELAELGDLEGARKLEAQAQDLLRSASVTIAALDKAGRTVWDATMKVHTQVVSAQVKNSNDLRDFSDHLQGSVYGTFQDVIGLARIPSQFKMKAGDEHQIQSAPQLSQEQKDRAKALNDAANQMKISMLTLGGDLQSIDVADLNSQFAACLNPIKQFQPVKALRIRPSSLVQLEPEGIVSVRVSGGTPPYTVTPSWSSSVDLKAEGPPTSGPAIVTITAGKKEKVQPGTYRLSVEDSAQDSVVIRIVVTASADETSSTERSSKPAPGGDVTVAEAMKSIKTALNTSETVRPSAWQGVKSTEWKADDSAASDNLRFYLTFTSDAATVAKRETNKVTKLRTFKSKTVFTVSTTGQDLELVIPKAEIDELLKAIGNKQWPDK